jgi:type IV secretory pathway VirJ component
MPNAIKVHPNLFVSVHLSHPGHLVLVGTCNMAKTRRRSSASASVSNDAIASARSNLNELSEKPKEKLSLREAIGELHESITAALDRGYSYEEVVEILSTQGVTITVASLKRYLAAARKEVSAQPKRRRTVRSRQAQLAKQAEALTGAASLGMSAQSDADTATTDSTSTPTAKKRRTTSRTKSAAKSATKPTAKTTTKSAAKTKPTSGAKTTSRSTTSRRKRGTASE